MSAYTVQEIDDLREAVISHSKQKFRMRRSELNMVHIESMVRTYMEAGIKADDVLAVVADKVTAAEKIAQANREAGYAGSIDYVS